MLTSLFALFYVTGERYRFLRSSLFTETPLSCSGDSTS